MIELAHRIDSGENLELDTKSKLEKYDFVIKSNIAENEIITQSNQEELKSDFVTKSMLSYGQAIEIAKQILKLKKSARISIAKIISREFATFIYLGRCASRGMLLQIIPVAIYTRLFVQNRSPQQKCNSNLPNQLLVD